MRTADFDYDLPAELIAQEPAPQRDQARLLVVDRQGAPLADRRFADLPALLPPDALLVMNDSRVIPARLRGHKPTGGEAEALLVRRKQNAEAEGWVALVRTSKRLRPGLELRFDHDRVVARVEDVLPDGAAVLLFSGPPAEAGPETFLAWVDRVGETPLPPYIERPEGERAFDRERYQTVYARPPGSVAAPTAGLHFTPALLAALDARGVERAFVTLHVGPGTFRPVRSEVVEEHVMDEEHVELGEPTVRAIRRAREAGRPVVAVGTTTVRALEGAAARGPLAPGRFATRLFIRPGFAFQVVDGLITNFHLPRSTLLMMVCAFGGEELILHAYREAVREGYRFYSYGDCMLIV